MARILVTGVGAVIGYGVLRSLQGLGHHLIGLDIFPDAYGQALADAFVPAVRTDDPAYPGFLRETLLAHRPDVVLPCIEQDVERFDVLRPLFEELGVACALNTSELIRLAADKWAFHEAEVAHGLSPIASVVSGDFAALKAALGLPFLLKPRRGYAGKGIVEIADAEAFAPYAPRMGERYLAQRKVGAPEAEYTVGAFGDGEGGVRAMIQMRRTLSGEGATHKAWVVDEPGLAARTAAYCAAFRPLGPTNLQFRRDGDAWALLEINPRISSAASLRAAFGYNEAQMAVSYYLAGEPPVQPKLRRGRAVRYLEDFVVFDDRPDL